MTPRAPLSVEARGIMSLLGVSSIRPRAPEGCRPRIRLNCQFNRSPRFQAWCGARKAEGSFLYDVPGAKKELR